MRATQLRPECWHSLPTGDKQAVFYKPNKISLPLQKPKSARFAELLQQRPRQVPEPERKMPLWVSSFGYQAAVPLRLAYLDQVSGPSRLEDFAEPAFEHFWEAALER